VVVGGERDVLTTETQKGRGVREGGVGLESGVKRFDRVRSEGVRETYY